MKPALGKGLGQLMKGQQVATPKPKSTEPPVETLPAGKVTAVDFGRGLNTLVKAQPQAGPVAVPARPVLPAWFFFAADLLLLAFTVAICLDAEKPMQWGEVMFASVATALGACLAIAGVLRASRRNEPTSN